MIEGIKIKLSKTSDQKSIQSSFLYKYLAIPIFKSSSSKDDYPELFRLYSTPRALNTASTGSE